MDRLCKYIYVRDNTDRLRTRAVLCHIYHMSLHDKWYEARDLMLMAHLQVSVVDIWNIGSLFYPPFLILNCQLLHLWNVILM